MQHSRAQITTASVHNQDGITQSANARVLVHGRCSQLITHEKLPLPDTRTEVGTDTRTVGSALLGIIYR
jgi:hypothetical protein